MHLRMCLFGVVLAALPVAIDVPSRPDSIPYPVGETRIEAMAGLGQYSLISRGCEGQILREVREQVTGGTLAMEHRVGDDWVVGVRGGTARSHVTWVTDHTLPVGGTAITVNYVNPWVAFDRPGFGIGAGPLQADQPLVLDAYRAMSPTWSGHLRLGQPKASLTLRVLEDGPLQVGPYMSAEIGVQPRPEVQVEFGPGFAGPYDGAMFGVRGRVWFTPEAALKVRAGLGSHGQYFVAAGTALRFGGRSRAR